MFQSDLHVDDCNSNISYQFWQYRFKQSDFISFPPASSSPIRLDFCIYIFLDKCVNFDMLCWILPNKHYTQTHMDVLAFIQYIVHSANDGKANERRRKNATSSCHVYICDSGTKNRQHSHSKTSQPTKPTDSRSLLFHYYTTHVFGVCTCHESPVSLVSFFSDFFEWVDCFTRMLF